MRIEPVGIERIITPGDDLFYFLGKLPRISERTVLAVTSKIVSLCENRVVSKSEIGRDDLIKNEADRYIPRNKIPGNYGILAVKGHVISIAAGVDEFNGQYVLWPEDPAASARRIWEYLRTERGLSEAGVIITDSHTVPLRRGQVGFALSYSGFEPVKSYKGSKDLFGRRMKMTRANIADSLAAASVLVMGEGGERTPFALVTAMQGIKFTTPPFFQPDPREGFEIPLEEDIYRPLLDCRVWKPGKLRKMRK